MRNVYKFKLIYTIKTWIHHNNIHNFINNTCIFYFTRETCLHIAGGLRQSAVAVPAASRSVERAGVAPL